MSLRDDVKQLLQFIGTTPTRVDMPQHNPKKIQVAISQLSRGKFRTIDCNGSVYVWRIEA